MQTNTNYTEQQPARKQSQVIDVLRQLESVRTMLIDRLTLSKPTSPAEKCNDTEEDRKQRKEIAGIKQACKSGIVRRANFPESVTRKDCDSDRKADRKQAVEDSRYNLANGKKRRRQRYDVHIVRVTRHGLSRVQRNVAAVTVSDDEMLRVRCCRDAFVERLGETYGRAPPLLDRVGSRPEKGAQVRRLHQTGEARTQRLAKFRAGLEPPTLGRFARGFSLCAFVGIEAAAPGSVNENNFRRRGHG